MKEKTKFGWHLSPTRQSGNTALNTVVIAAMIAAFLIFSPAPANASTIITGSSVFPGSMSGFDNGNGTIQYCAEPAEGAPTGMTTDTGIQLAPFTTSHGNALSSQQAAGLNMIITEHGQDRTNPDAISAVAAVVKYVMNPVKMVSDNGNTGPQTFDGQIDWTVKPANRANVRALANQWLQDAQNYNPTPPVGVPAEQTVILTLKVDQAHNYDGTVTITSLPTSPAQATIRLVNGIFKNNPGVLGDGTSTITGTFRQGQVFNVLGAPPINTGPEGYKISGTFDGTATIPAASPNYAAALAVSTTPRAQDTFGPGGKVPPVNTKTQQKGAFIDPSVRRVPQTSSRAQPLASPGSKAYDDVTISGSASAFPSGGVDVIDRMYILPGLLASASDVCVNPVFTSAPITFTTADTKRIETTVPVTQPAGTHVQWVHSTYIRGTTTNPINSSSCGEVTESTPIKDVVVKTIPPVKPAPGTSVQDTIKVDGWVAPETTVVVTQYMVPSGQTLVCTPANQIGPDLLPVLLKEGLNEGTIYTTQRTGALVVGHGGFVEKVYVGKTLIHTSGCQDELFDVVPPVVPPVVTPPTSAPPVVPPVVTPPASAPPVVTPPNKLPVVVG